MSKYISPWHLLLLCSIFALMHWQYLHGNSQRGRPTTGSRTAYCPSPTGAVAVQLTQPATASFPPWFACWLAMEDVAVHRLATSITQLTLCQVTTDEIDAATKLLDKACQKLRGIPDVPPQRITDLETAIRQLRQLSCILDSCTISASYEVSQAQKALLLMPRTAKGASTSSDELNAQVSLPTDDEYHAFQDQDQLQEH